MRTVEPRRDLRRLTLKGPSLPGDHLEGRQAGIGGVRDPAPVGLHLAERVDGGAGDPLTGGEHRDAGRVGRDQLSADPPDGHIGADGLVPREERLPGR